MKGPVSHRGAAGKFQKNPKQATPAQELYNDPTADYAHHTVYCIACDTVFLHFKWHMDKKHNKETADVFEVHRSEQGQGFPIRLSIEHDIATVRTLTVPQPRPHAQSYRVSGSPKTRHTSIHNP
jgi:hypothetical protein